MHKRILFILLLSFPVLLTAQNFIEDFGDVPSLFSNGWVQQNNSTPAGPGTWRQDFGNFNAPFGTDTSSIVANYASVSLGHSGDISNWLITPVINFTPGDSIVFWTISYQNGSYPDRLEVRLNRSNTTDVGFSSTSTGDFDTVLFTINPNLVITSGGYPMIWTRYACKINGVTPGTPCRIGLRYFVTNGGQTGNNGSTIGIDHFEYKSIFTGLEDEDPLYAYVQLIDGQISVKVPEATHSFSAELLDVSGKTIYYAEYEKEGLIDLGRESHGIYLVRIIYEGKYLIKKISF
jgi:hypothetical protein